MIGKFVGIRGLAVVFAAVILAPAAQADWRAGAAKVNISPRYPVRLSGYGNRKTEHEGVKVDIWAKALAIAWGDEQPAVILTVDNCGIPGSLRAEVLAGLQELQVKDERFAICSTHTHCAPMVNGMLKNMFGQDLVDEEQAHVDRYTNDLRQWLINAATSAIKGMRASKLEVGSGTVSFAGNRRYPSPGGMINSPNPDGPVDHDLPVLKVSDAKTGEVSAIFTSYACHCTTMNWNFVHPDWAGLAQLHLEMAFPKAVALTALGCGGDQNPYPRREENVVRIHGYNLAKEAKRVVSKAVRKVDGPLLGAQRTVQLPFDAAPTATQLQQRLATAKSVHDKYFAAHFLGMMERKESLPTALPYNVMVWRFGEDLAMVFLNGEVVVDYSLRLKREFEPRRLWVNAYANDVPAYIPSERVLTEGGYEGGGAMTYYLRPNKFAPGLEDKIIGAVHELVPDTFKPKAVTAGK